MTAVLEYLLSKERVCLLWYSVSYCFGCGGLYQAVATAT